MAKVSDSIKEEFANLVAKRDVLGLRGFLATHVDLLADGLYARMLAQTDAQLLEFMEQWTAVNAVFGSLALESRNELRIKELESNLSLATKDLVDHLRENEHYPSCAECEWFRSVPPNETHACMHLGGAPTDVCCAGWTNLRDVSRSD